MAGWRRVVELAMSEEEIARLRYRIRARSGRAEWNGRKCFSPVRTMVGFPPEPTGNLMLKCYLEGWAEANSAKILAATAPGYRFRDPFVGSFSIRRCMSILILLQDRLSRVGMIRRTDVVFFLSGPVDRPGHVRKLQLWREAPAVRLSGVSEIEFGQQGVIAESVSYDLNLAPDTLLRTL